MLSMWKLEIVLFCSRAVNILLWIVFDTESFHQTCETVANTKETYVIPFDSFRKQTFKELSLETELMLKAVLYVFHLRHYSVK